VNLLLQSLRDSKVPLLSPGGDGLGRKVVSFQDMDGTKNTGEEVVFFQDMAEEALDALCLSLEPLTIGGDTHSLLYVIISYLFILSLYLIEFIYKHT